MDDLEQRLRRIPDDYDQHSLAAENEYATSDDDSKWYEEGRENVRSVVKEAADTLQRYREALEDLAHVPRSIPTMQEIARRARQVKQSA